LTRVQLILAAAVGAGVEVAAGAGLLAVAADLHVPEQQLAELLGCALVGDEVAQVVSAWQRRVRAD
jgi:hypothetical protein